MASVSVRRGGSVRDVAAALVGSAGGVIPIASEFLSYVSLRGCSPNTVLAYAYELAHLWRFFEAGGLSWDQLTPQRSPELLVYLRALPSTGRPRFWALSKSTCTPLRRRERPRRRSWR